MNILWLATKAPWPAVDGGRLVAQLTLEALVTRGHRITVLAPAPGNTLQARHGAERGGYRLELVTAAPQSRWMEALKTPWARKPWTIRRHTLPAMARRAVELVQGERFDLVHSEQAQALSSAEQIQEHLPVVLRAQNVESDLWHGLAARRPVLAPGLRLEARRLAAWEGAAVCRSAATVTLTSEDAARLGELANLFMETQAVTSTATKPIAVPASFPAFLEGEGAVLSGSPALVLFGSAGWWPNRDGMQWFLEHAWPVVRSSHPGAVLHLFGSQNVEATGVVTHDAPRDSADALVPGSALIVPLFVASGVRMKILEAWARGVPVIASPAAVRGLDAQHDENLLIADDPHSWADAVARLDSRREGLIEAARSSLESNHAPLVVAERLEAVYQASH